MRSEWMEMRCDSHQPVPLLPQYEPEFGPDMEPGSQVFIAAHLHADTHTHTNKDSISCRFLLCASLPFSRSLSLILSRRSCVVVCVSHHPQLSCIGAVAHSQHDCW
jgi:hypothetical protein